VFGSLCLYLRFDLILAPNIFLTMSFFSKSKSKPSGVDIQKKQTFKFRRSKVVTTTNKLVCLGSDKYGVNTSVATLQEALTNNLPVSHSGRTLADILSLSYPEKPSSYTVERVVPGLGKEGTLVEYHRSEGEAEVTFSLLQICSVPFAYLGHPEEAGIARDGSGRTSVRAKTIEAGD
jgi:hypothetical protein